MTFSHKNKRVKEAQHLEVLESEPLANHCLGTAQCLAVLDTCKCETMKTWMPCIKVATWRENLFPCQRWVEINIIWESF